MPKTNMYCLARVRQKAGHFCSGLTRFTPILRRTDCAEPDVINVMLVGDVELTEGQTEEDALRDQAKTEISLTLSNKFEVPDDDDSDLRALFVRYGD